MYFTVGEDYVPPPKQYMKVMFHGGLNVVSFDIHITDDNKIEDIETFRITIFDLSLPNDVKLGSPASAEVTIMDDDSKHSYVYTYNGWLVSLSESFAQFLQKLINIDDQNILNFNK